MAKLPSFSASIPPKTPVGVDSGQVWDAAFPVADWGTSPIGPVDIDVLILATLVKWSDTYLNRIEEEMGTPGHFDPHPSADHFNNALSSMEFLDVTLPAIVVTTADTPGPPVQGADSARAGVYAADWRVVVSSIVRGDMKAQARQNASDFEKTMRRLLLDQAVRMPGTRITAIAWKGSKVTPVPNSAGNSRFLAAGISQFIVSTDDAATADSGPDVPDADSYGELPLVTNVPQTFTFDPITEE